MNDSIITRSQERVVMLRRLFILFALMIAGLFLAGVIMMFIGASSTPRVRISTIVQDFLVFIIPAIATALLSSRLPARFLGIDRGFRPSMLLAAVLVMIVSIPFQNWLIALNESITLPASLASLERSLEAYEENARASITLLMGGTSAADLIMSLLIVGIFAGLSEELFFRGAMQKIFQRNSSNPTAAIWITAVVFALFHMQFYGIIPRLLLGAFFGYLLVWSGSLWLPVLIHIFNNSVVVVTDWHARSTGTDNVVDSFGVSPAMVIVSVILTALGLYLLSRMGRQNHRPD